MLDLDDDSDEEVDRERFGSVASVDTFNGGSFHARGVQQQIQQLNIDHFGSYTDIAKTGLNENSTSTLGRSDSGFSDSLVKNVSEALSHREQKMLKEKNKKWRKKQKAAKKLAEGGDCCKGPNE